MSQRIDSTDEAGSEFRFANSHRVYLRGSQDSINVPFREVHLNVTRKANGEVEQNPPVRIYDTSGPWGDADVRAEVHDGIAAIRRGWITGRGDVEEYEGRSVEPRDDGYLTGGLASMRWQKIRPSLSLFPAR